MLDELGDEGDVRLSGCRWRRHRERGRPPLLDRDLHARDEDLAVVYDFIIDRQVAADAVRSTERTWPVIELSYERLPTCSSSTSPSCPSCSGNLNRPFGLYGDSGQPTPMTWWNLMEMGSWSSGSWWSTGSQPVDDLSWADVDGDEGGGDRRGAARRRGRPARPGRSTYALFMVANAAALDSRADDAACEIVATKYSARRCSNTRSTPSGRARPTTISTRTPGGGSTRSGCNRREQLFVRMGT